MSFVVMEEPLTRVVCHKVSSDGELKQWAENGSLEILEVVAQKPLGVNSVTLREAWEPVPDAVFQEAQGRRRREERRFSSLFSPRSLH